MAPSNSPRPSTQSSVSKKTLDATPAQVQTNMSTDAPTARRNGGSIRGKIANMVSRIFGNKKVGMPESSRSGNGEPSAFRSSQSPPSVTPLAPNDISSSISQKKIIPATSSKRMTRTQTAVAGNSNAEPPSKKSKKGRNTAQSKDISEEDRAKYMAQSNPAAFMIPRPLSKGPRPPRPIAHHLGVEVGKPARPEPEPKPLPLSWHRRHNELRAIEMAGEEAAERAAEKAMPSFVIGIVDDADEGIGGSGSSFVPEEVKYVEEEMDEGDVPFVSQEKENGKNFGKSPKENNEDFQSPDLPAISTTKLLRVRFVKKMDKGKGKAVESDTEDPSTKESDTKEPAEVPDINLRTGSLPQISDDYNGIGEPTWASSSTDFSWLPFITPDTENGPDEPTVPSGRKTKRSPVPVPMNPLAKPLKKLSPNQDVIDECLHNRTRVVVGTPQPEALKLVFKTGKEDSAKPGVMLHLSTVTYQYEKLEVDWNCAKFVKGLNKWRSQILLRLLGNKSEPRLKWTHGEMEALCSIVESHLTSPEVRGSWAKIDWELVAATYNDQFEGSISKPGKAIVVDRVAPVRSSDGVRNQMLHFTDPRATNLVKAAKSKNKAAGLVSSSAGSSNTKPAWPANVPLKKIVIVHGSRTAHLTLKRRRESNEDSDEDDKNECPPNKKNKLITSARRRGGILMNEYNPNFSYVDDSPPSGDAHGRHFPDDSPFQIARNNKGEATRAIKAMANAQHLLNRGEMQANIAVDPVPDQHPAVNKNRSNKGRENGDEEVKSSPRKVKLGKRLARNSRAPSTGQQDHHPHSNAPSRAPIAAMTPLASTSNLKKRLRDEEQAESGDHDEQELPLSKKAKKDSRLPSMNIRGPNILPAAALEPQVTNRSINDGPRRSLNGRINGRAKKSKDKAHLPTLDDYLAED
ncbi:hypothetical protein EYC80_007659 [Monilinia laxa]|uniref:Uncharacterized protein n=1 Tax=Monilinia laxa TaxID=61186 RepID=A0A5N6JWN8_MONLA|nr:hypothetical protein EYC80_007659 [Monilinia laxa]